MPDNAPLTVPIPYLAEAERDEVAARTSAWAAVKAGEVLAEVVELGGAISQLAEWAKTSPSPYRVLVALAGAEAQLHAELKVARLYAAMAGPYLPVHLGAALAHFPQERVAR